ncbi:MAG: response regulator [Deltaproteobacteria bacterium]|nr:response regulator [Deltaproteobacteria bacterium]
MNYNIAILIVDDFESMRRIVKGTLKSIGFSNFIEAEDGVVALKKLEKHKIDLIISDWIMPNMNGLDFLKAVKGNDKYKNIPFIMVTAEGQKGNVLEAINAGVNNYIVKPFTPETLNAKLQKVLD